MSFQSDVRLGHKYRDDQTGIVGVATAVHFYQYACERVTLEYVAKKGDGAPCEVTFDAPRLTHVQTAKRLTTTRTGGPARAGETRTRSDAR